MPYGQCYTGQHPANQHREAREILEVFGTYIKLAVDVERQVVAGGGELHYDCEQALLDDGSRQADVWGADWDPVGKVRFESLINIRPPTRQSRSGVAVARVA